jgi:hypothetical protein
VVISSGLYAQSVLTSTPLHLEISSIVTVLSISIIFHSKFFSGFIVKPYFSGFFDINIIANILGTYKRVSLGNPDPLCLPFGTMSQNS